MAENTDTPPPPPSYEEAVYILRDTPSISASDPSLARRGRNDQGTIPSSGRRSQQYLPVGTSDSQPLRISDSPHSSDDEETAMLKAELRRLRDKDYNEQKKALLRQMVEEERRAAAVAAAAVSDGGARGTRQDWHPPPQQHTYPAGAIVHPVASNIPGIVGPQPYAAPLQCPSTSVQEPGPSCTIEEPLNPSSNTTAQPEIGSILMNFQQMPSSSSSNDVSAIFVIIKAIQDDKDRSKGCVGVFICMMIVVATVIIGFFIFLT